MEIQPNQAYLDREALAVMGLRATDEFHPVLTGICIKKGVACCADGFALAESKIQQGKDFPDCVLDAEQIIAAKQLIGFGGVIIAFDQGQYVATGRYRIIIDTISGTYPDIASLCRNAGSNQTQGYIGIGLFQLERLVKSAKKAGENYIVFRISGIDKTVEYCTGVDSSFKGLIMPYYRNDYESMDWPSRDYAKSDNEAAGVK